MRFKILLFVCSLFIVGCNTKNIQFDLQDMNRDDMSFLFLEDLMPKRAGLLKVSFEF